LSANDAGGADALHSTPAAKAASPLEAALHARIGVIGVIGGIRR